MENDSNPQQKNSADCRKSKRARKPNSFYVQGVTQSKKVCLDITKPISKPKKKVKAQDDDYQSYSYERDEKPYQNRPCEYENSEEWLSCYLPDRKKIKISVYFKGLQKPIDKKKKEQKIVDAKPKGQTDLLSLFQKAIQDVAVQEMPKPKPKLSSIVYEDHHLDLQKIPSQTYRIPSSKKVQKEDKQGRVERAVIEEGTLKFFHSKLGQINFDTNWNCQEPIQNEEETRQINQLIEKLKKRKVLPAILTRRL